MGFGPQELIFRGHLLVRNFVIFWVCNTTFSISSSTKEFFCGKKSILNRDAVLLGSPHLPLLLLFFAPQKPMLRQMLLRFIFHLGGIFKYRKQFYKLPAVSVLLGLHGGSNNLWKNSTCVFPGNGIHNIDEFQMKGIYLIQDKWRVSSLSISRNWLQNVPENYFLVP